MRAGRSVAERPRCRAGNRRRRREKTGRRGHLVRPAPRARLCVHRQNTIVSLSAGPEGVLRCTQPPLKFCHPRRVCRLDLGLGLPVLEVAVLLPRRAVITLGKDAVAAHYGASDPSTTSEARGRVRGAERTLAEPTTRARLVCHGDAFWRRLAWLGLLRHARIAESWFTSVEQRVAHRRLGDERRVQQVLRGRCVELVRPLTCLGEGLQDVRPVVVVEGAGGRCTGLRRRLVERCVEVRAAKLHGGQLKGPRRKQP